MTALNNGEIIVVDTDEALSFNIKYMLANSLKNVALINTRCICGRVEEISQIMKDSFLLKMVYGCDEREYDAVINNFQPAGDVFHLGKRFFFSEAVTCYWKNKGFEQFNPTFMLGRNGLESL